MISKESIDKVKDAANVVDVIGGIIKLKKVGKDHTAICPFHDEKTPSFSVSGSKNIFKCFGCGKSGDSITFLIEHEKLSYIDAIRWLASKYRIELEEKGQRKEYVKPQARIEKLSHEVIEYFETKRKISNNTLLRFNVTQSREWMPKNQKEVNAVCFNYYKNGELVNTKFRATGKDFKMVKDAELIFYNIDAIKDEKEAYIVEGEIDCLSLYECGIYNCVSVPNGAAPGENQRLDYLDNCWHYFTNKTKVVLMVDNDAAGKRLRDELGRRIGFEKCWTVEYLDGCKDSNDVLVRYGRDALRDVAHKAQQWPIKGLVKMDDMFETVCDFYENGYPKGYEAGLGSFDELLTFYPGQLTVITGIPGSGKSEFIDWIMASLSKKCGLTWGICSFENPPEFHVTKLAEKFTDRAFSFRKNPEHRMGQRAFEEAIAVIDKHFHFINMSLIDVTMDGLIEKATELVERKGINGLLFDPWNCIEHKYDESQSETKYVLACLNKLIAFLEKYRVIGFLVAHPTKLKKDPRTNKYEIPTLYSISGSAHFFNRTHNGISIYRDFETNVVDAYVQKVKWSWLGKTGFCSYNFDTYTRAYTSIN